MGLEDNKKPLVISMDGPDGTGKTTQVQLLEDQLKNAGRKVLTTRVSGGTPLANELRKIAFSDLDRGDDIDLYIHFAMYSSLVFELNKIRGNYEIILIDRSPLSMLAYNGFAAEIENLIDAFEGCERYFKKLDIDILFYLNAPQEILRQRLSGRGKSSDYYEKQGNEFFQRVREGFDKGISFMEEKQDKLKIYRLNASDSIEAINQEIQNNLKNIL